MQRANGQVWCWRSAFPSFRSSLSCQSHSQVMSVQMQQILAPSPPPSLHDDSPAWSDNISASSLDVRRRIFCNRSLNMAHIKVNYFGHYSLDKHNRFGIPYHLGLLRIHGYPAHPYFYSQSTSFEERQSYRKPIALH